MEFDKSRVFTALNAGEVKIGSKVIAANNIDSLKCKVHAREEISEVIKIFDASYERRFQLLKEDYKGAYPFVYLVSEPPEIWIVYLCRRNAVEPYLTSCRSDRWESVKKDYGAKTKLFEGTDDEAEAWYTARRNFTNEIAAWEDGETIQLLEDGAVNWIDVVSPTWDINTQYRIKPSLKWTDLKLGDVIRRKDGLKESMVMMIDKDNETQFHIYAGSWLNANDLEYYEKVDDYYEYVNEKVE